METNKKESKFAVPEQKYKPETYTAKEIIWGTIIILVGAFFAMYAQRGVDGGSEMSFLGLVVMVGTWVAVSYCLEKVVSRFLKK